MQYTVFSKSSLFRVLLVFATALFLASCGGGGSGGASFTVSPSSGSVDGGTLVTITGASLSGATGVTIGGAAATSLTTLSSTQISVITPAGTAGAQDVVVTLKTATTLTVTGGFTYVAWPGTSTLSTEAGDGTFVYGGDNGSALSATLASPLGGAVDSDGNYYFADGSRIRVLAQKTGSRLGVSMTAGKIYTVAGTGTPGFSGDTASALAAEVDVPQAVALDASGNLYIADTNNRRIRVVANVATTLFAVPMAVGKIYTVAGSGNPGFSVNGTLATAANMSGPYGLAVDSAGNLFIADTSNSRVRVVSQSGGTILGVSTAALNIYTVAGTGVAGVSADGTAGTSALLDTPVALALDANDNLFIADKADTSVGAFVQVLPKTSGTVLGVAVTANQVFNVAGKNAGASLGDGAAATSAVLSKPYSIAVDSAGNLFIADFLNNRIRVVAQSNLTRIGVAMTTGNIYTAVGTGTPAFSGDGGSPAAAEIDSPNGVALDSNGYLYVADQGNSRIRRATP